MELIGIELLSLIIVGTILFSRRSVRASVKLFDISSVYPVLFSYLFYLVVALLSHGSMRGYVSYPGFFNRLLAIVHTISFPVFIIAWMSHLERRTLPRRVYRTLMTAQGSLLLIFAVLSVADLAWGRLYRFSAQGTLAGGSGIYAMMLFSATMAFVGVCSVVAGWQHLDKYARLVYSLSPSFLLLSLLFFHLFKQPYMFALSSTFMLLLSFILFQRRELERDQLTGTLHNVAFLERLDQLVRTKQPATIMAVDIENFRLVNDRFGKHVGDAILQEFSYHLIHMTNRNSVFRIGGNRFALVQPRLTHNAIVRQVRALNGRVAEGWPVGEAHISFHVNTAIIEVPLHGSSSAQVLEALDFTMTEIKARRRQVAIIFNRKLTLLQQRRLDVLTAVRRALSHESMVIVHYQPIYDTSNGHIIAAEALMRLQDEQLGMISPGEFIPAAEQAGLISRLTETMLRKVTHFLASHEALFKYLSHVSINISADDLVSPETSRRLLEIIDTSNIDPHKIGFEVTESMLLLATDTVKNAWEAYVDKGILFMLDDFGTGYSNLETLVKLPFKVVKIDRSVVSNSHNNFELITLISVMLERLGKQMVAEGVETREQLDFIQAAGIEYVQGFFFSKPVPEDQLLDLIRFDNAK